MIPDFKDLAHIYQQCSLESLSEEDLAHAKRYRIAAELVDVLRECRETLISLDTNAQFTVAKETIAKIDEVLNEDR